MPVDKDVLFWEDSDNEVETTIHPGVHMSRNVDANNLDLDMAEADDQAIQNNSEMAEANTGVEGNDERSNTGVSQIHLADSVCITVMVGVYH